MSSKREPIVRRTISKALQTTKGWTVETSVDGSIRVVIPSARTENDFAKEVRLAVEALGYNPTLAIRGRVVTFTTPETREQAKQGRGVHGAATASPPLRQPLPLSQTQQAPTSIPRPAEKAPRTTRPDLTPNTSAAAIAQLPWVKALRPMRDPYLARLSDHSDLVVWHVDVEFRQWVIPKEESQRWLDSRTSAEETWQKRPLVIGEDSQCGYSCGEVELAARLRTAGFQAYWISEWIGFAHVSCWQPFCIKRNELARRAREVNARDAQLRAKALQMGIDLGRAGGHPDIAAWSEGSSVVVYMEYKGPGDSIKLKQNAWAETIIASESPETPFVAVKGVIRN